MPSELLILLTALSTLCSFVTAKATVGKAR
jgi:hypothetical protein